MVTGIKNWSTTPGDNDSAPPNGAPEGMPPSSVNDVMRQNMADIREWYEDPIWIDYGYTTTYIDADTFRIAGDRTELLTVGRRVRAIGTGYTIYGSVTAAAYTTPNTDVDVAWDSGTLDNTLTSVMICALDITGKPVSSLGIKFEDDTVPNDALDPTLVADVATALARPGVPTGAIMGFYKTTAPTGWLKVNGDTIGSAASGATHADDLTEDLFLELWAEDQTANQLAIFTSGGSSSTKGASAAADWAADKRLSLPEIRGEFIRALDDGRGVDGSRVLGSAQTGQVGAITINARSNSDVGFLAQVAGSLDSVFDLGTSGSKNVTINSGAENLVRNKALLMCIKL